MVIVVASCPKRRPIQDLWKQWFQAVWPTCPWTVEMLSPEKDIGWNANLLAHIRSMPDGDCMLLLLDDHFISGDSTAEVNQALELMREDAQIGMMKLQAGNAWPPEIPFPTCDRLREYDREHHPFKRTNLVPTLFRVGWLKRLLSAILETIGPGRDCGRRGALEFEVTGTLLTEDVTRWPEKILGIHRPEPRHHCENSFVNCIDNDAIREGRFKQPVLKILTAHRIDYASIPGIEPFLPLVTA